MTRPPHPSDIILPEPIRISPLIRLTRWSAFAIGIVYGYFRFYHHAVHHATIREEEAVKFIHNTKEELFRAALKGKYEGEFVNQITGTPLDEGRANVDIEHLYVYEETDQKA